jgi:hypothetical protein
LHPGVVGGPSGKTKKNDFGFDRISTVDPGIASSAAASVMTEDLQLMLADNDKDDNSLNGSQPGINIILPGNTVNLLAILII